MPGCVNRYSTSSCGKSLVVSCLSFNPFTHTLQRREVYLFEFTQNIWFQQNREEVHPVARGQLLSCMYCGQNDPVP